MALESTKSMLKLSGIVSVEEAETLFDWLQRHPKGKVDLSRCEHLHAANLQVLLAFRPKIHALPADESLAGWLKYSLNSEQEN